MTIRGKVSTSSNLPVMCLIVGCPCLHLPMKGGEVMDKQTDENEIIQGDSYQLFVPIEDHDLLKSVSVDENGDYIVQGVMTSDEQDEEDDSITPEGMDCSYFLEKGWVKYEHGNKPEQFIGEPMEVKVGRFEHPTLMKSVNGIFVKARLFATRALTKQAIEAMNDLQKSNTKRRMGWSIEGNVKERDKKTGKIIKSVLRNVVLTMNPVNTTTWAELAKSFAKDHELTIDMPDIEKAMDVEGAQPITRQSIEGYDPKTDEQEEWIKIFRSVVKQALLKKSFRKEFVASPEDAELLAFSEAINKGLDYREAEQLASYIAEKHEVLSKAITAFTKYGGETMSEVKGTLSSLLDADLEELQKSLEADNEDDQDVNEDDYQDEDENEEVEKALDTDGDEGDEGEPEGDEDDEEGEPEGDEEGDEEGEEVEKSFRTDLSKSLSNEHKQAFEVSDFLLNLTDEIGYSLEGMEKSIMSVAKSNNAIVKSLATFGSVMQSALSKIEALEAQNEDLQKSLSDVMNRPVGRKGVVNQREVQTLSKSLGSQGQAPRNRKEVEDLLMKSFEAGEIPGSVITRFEAGTPLQNMNLPDNLKKSLGL